MTQTVGERLDRGLSERLWAVVVAAVLCVAACGPIQASSTVGDAEEAIEAAQEAEALQYAQYEYWMAIFYLDKAKRVEGRAEYSAAENFAEESAKFAAAAVEVAAKEKMRQQVMQQRLKSRRKGAR